MYIVNIRVLLLRLKIMTLKSNIIPYVNFIFETFESKRLMWGSDWPVVTMSENYSGWIQRAKNTVLTYQTTRS